MMKTITDKRQEEDIMRQIAQSFLAAESTKDGFEWEWWPGDAQGLSSR